MASCSFLFIPEKGVALLKTKDIVISAACTLAIILVVLYFVDVGAVAGVLEKADLRLIAAAVVAYFTLNVLMSWRIQKLLDGGNGGGIPLGDCVKANFAGMLVSDFTPARSGYFFTAISITAKFKREIERTLLAILGPQMLEFGIKALGLLLMFIIFIIPKMRPSESDLTTIALAVAAIFISIGCMGFIIFTKHGLRLLEPLKRVGLGKKAYHLVALMQANMETVKRNFPMILSVSLATWFLKGVEWFLLSRALGLGIFGVWQEDLLFFLLLHPTITLIQFIPIPTLAGAGTSEAATTAILMLFGVPAADGFAFALLTRFLMIFVDLLGAPSVVEFIQGKGLASMLDEINRIEGRAGG